MHGPLLVRDFLNPDLTLRFPAQGPPPSVGGSPYGTFGTLPALSVPEPKQGLAARPTRGAVVSSRPSALLTMRTATPKFGVPLRREGSMGSSPFSLGGTGMETPDSAGVTLPAR